MALSLKQACYSELIIKKSRFLGCVQPVDNRSQAVQIVKTLWLQHPSATHICWALMAGGQSAANDDGEPSGTAGRPMLEVLRHQNLEQVLATVVRYFGGIQLGAGGLVRAYTDSVAQALLSAEKIELQKMQQLCCVFPYELEGRVRRELQLANIELQEVQHASLVTFNFSVAQSQSQQLVANLTNLGQGQLVWRT